MGFTTKQIHAGVTPDPVTGAILTPIYQSTTYVQHSVDEYLSKGYSYSRSGNPTVRGARAEDRGARERRRLHLLFDRDGGRAGRVPGDAVRRAITPSCPTSPTAARIASRTKIYSRFGVRLHVRRHGEPRRRAQGAFARTRS